MTNRLATLVVLPVMVALLGVSLGLLAHQATGHDHQDPHHDCSICQHFEANPAALARMVSLQPQAAGEVVLPTPVTGLPLAFPHPVRSRAPPVV